MRLPTMTTQRWMVFVAAFAMTLTAWIVCQRWVAAKVAGFLEQAREQMGLPQGAPLGDFNISVSRDMAFWINIGNFLHRFWFALAILAVLFSFTVAAMFPQGTVKAQGADSPVHNQ